MPVRAQVDLKVTDRATGAETRYVQCDYRDREAIAARPALSSVLTLARIATARARNPVVPVEQTCGVEPPPFFVDAVVAAGAGVRVEDRVLVAAPQPPPPPETMDGFVDRAFAALAAESARTAGVTLDRAGLEERERWVLTSITSDLRREDPLRYWTAVVELAAIAGELLRGLGHGGGWCFAADVHPPFVFAIPRADGAVIRINPLGKVVKLIEAGAMDSVVGLVVSVRSYLDPP